MELLLDNLRNALFKGKHGKIKEIALPHRELLIGIAVTLSISVLVGRSSLYHSIEAVSIALVTVLMMRSKANIYALPFICFGMLSAIRTSYDYLGDIAALMLCTIIFLLPLTRKFPLTLRALIAGTSMICVKVAFYLWSGFLFLYDGKTMALDLLILFGSIYIFHVFFMIVEKGLQSNKNPIETIIVLSAVILMAIGGLGIPGIGPVSLLHITAFIIALTIGYGMGPGAGGISGIVSGFLIMVMTYETPALAGILGCCGVIAGFFFGKRRIVASICFAGLALSFGMLKGFPDLYISIYEPIVASTIFILIPAKIMDQFMKVLSLLRQDDNYYELTARKNVKDQIKQYADLFTKLSLSSGSMRTYYPSRDIMSQQFKGMARALEKISAEVSSGHQPLQARKTRYSLKTATAGYAKEGRISGDSCICTPVNEGEYLLALSDGMGQGIRASEESNLTVNTLYNLIKAGFEVELALRMVNSILLQKSNDEILSTLDMGFINLYTGKAKIFKIGAAAGFIRRGDDVKVIKMSALPLGIIERIPVESISMQLKKGDMLII
ncbi:MAG TPA: SpoIIE family protein phosphatase, partial [Anaerovoracaceae bacterium]|nr:SpoIIE family protein phosphatase [Anaerovoracaceae bacterium]